MPQNKASFRTGLDLPNSPKMENQLMKNLPLAEIIDMLLKIFKFFKKGKNCEKKTNEQISLEKSI